MTERLTSFSIGLGVGVAAAMLFAPKSGAKTRASLASGVQKGQDFLKQQGNELRDTIDRGHFHRYG